MFLHFLKYIVIKANARKILGVSSWHLLLRTRACVKLLKTLTPAAKSLLPAKNKHDVSKSKLKTRKKFFTVVAAIFGPTLLLWTSLDWKAQHNTAHEREHLQKKIKISI